MAEKAATPAHHCVFKKQAEYVPSMQTVGGWGEKKGEELIKPYMLIKLHFQFRKYPRKYLQFLSPTLQAKTTLKAGRRKLVPPPFVTIASAFSSPSGLVRTAPPSSDTTEDYHQVSSRETRSPTHTCRNTLSKLLLQRANPGP